VLSEPETTEEIRALLKDLKVLGKSDFKCVAVRLCLLSWRIRSQSLPLLSACLSCSVAWLVRTFFRCAGWADAAGYC
jgi:hypothetical protein